MSPSDVIAVLRLALGFRAKWRRRHPERQTLKAAERVRRVVERSQA